MAKVFVSHSSNDKDVVRLFKDLVLKSGFGLSDNDIFFTSSPETGVPVGENIPKYIKENLIDCECVFLMISKDYKQSEVCLNEMGAAMVISKKLIPVLLYNFDFNNVGWLIDKNLCVRINDEERLDEIRDYFVELGVPSRTSVWNRYRSIFINSIPDYDKEVENEPSKGLLDYQQEIADNQEKYERAIVFLNSTYVDCCTKVNELINIHNASSDMAERKALLGEAADQFNKLADELMRTTSIVSSTLSLSITAAENILKLRNVPIEDKKSLIESISDFLQSCRNNRDTLISNLSKVESQTDMEQRQIMAKNRVLVGCSSLLSVYEVCIERIDKIIKS